MIDKTSHSDVRRITDPATHMALEGGQMPACPSRRRLKTIQVRRPESTIGTIIVEA
ncbi:hypothetical protein [Streptomyces sp. NPDC056987]|uniref:hypothetical protein n=1 Tax=Streptomyces sp. NPDC056987 TaxID=3345988 RepID=UPI00363DC2A7